MDSVKKIVNCTPEQYLTLLKEGQVEVNGEVKTKEDGTLYNPGELPLLEWYNKIMEAQHKEFEVMHTPVVTKTLEEDYNAILAEYPDYTYSSAIGYRAFLKKGDIIEVESQYNNGEVFINRERVTYNYSCKSDGVEDVRVWVFESGIYIKNVPAFPPVLGATPAYYPYEINIRNVPVGQVPEVAQNYYLYANKITTYGFDLPLQPRACRVLITNGTKDFTQLVGSITQEVYSDCEQITTTGTNLQKHTVVKFSFPNCKTISANESPVFNNCTSAITWEFGKLLEIIGNIKGNSNYAAFKSVNTVLIPNTVKTVSGVICRDNKSIRLECNKATSISYNWCANAPTVSFSMAKDWDATVDIATAAANWNKEQFKDLFENYLVDNTTVSPAVLRTITIPIAINDTLIDEGIIDIALNKGWMIDER